MVRCIFSLGILAGLLLSMAGMAQAEPNFSPVTTMKFRDQPLGFWRFHHLFYPEQPNFTDSGSWNNGVPTSTANAYIGGNGGSGYTANLFTGSQAASYLYLGTGTGSYVGYGTLNMTSGASLNVANSMYVGYQNNRASPWLRRAASTPA